MKGTARETIERQRQQAHEQRPRDPSTGAVLYSSAEIDFLWCAVVDLAERVDALDHKDTDR